MTANSKSLSTLETLAARWGVSVRTLRRMVARGELKAHRIGTQLRFSEEDVTAYERLRRGRVRWPILIHFVQRCQHLIGRRENAGG